MRILLGPFLLAVSLAAPLNVENTPHDSPDLGLFGPNPVEKWIMRVSIERELSSMYEEMGVPKSAIDEYIDMEMEIMSPSADMEGLTNRVIAWHEKWDPTMTANQIRKGYRGVGYPEEAIDEYLYILDLANANKDQSGKDERLQAWEEKWAPALEENLNRKTLSLAGFPEEAIEQYLALGLARSGEINNRTEARREKWQTMWQPVQLENTERKALKEAGYPDHAIEEYIRDGLHIADGGETTAERIAKWHEKYDEEMNRRALRKVFSGFGLPPAALDEFVDLSLHPEKDVNGTRVEEFMQKWGSSMTAVGLAQDNDENESRRQVFVKTATIFERTNQAAQMLLSFAQTEELTEKKMEELKGYVEMLPGYEGRLLKKVFNEVEQMKTTEKAVQPL